LPSLSIRGRHLVRWTAVALLKPTAIRMHRRIYRVLSLHRSSLR
jgi:hypothetical protein